MKEMIRIRDDFGLDIMLNQDQIEVIERVEDEPTGMVALHINLKSGKYYMARFKDFGDVVNLYEKFE